jgi:hypothetical protein
MITTALSLALSNYRTRRGGGRQDTVTHAYWQSPWTNPHPAGWHVDLPHTRIVQRSLFSLLLKFSIDTPSSSGHSFFSLWSHIPPVRSRIWIHLDLHSRLKYKILATYNICWGHKWHIEHKAHYNFCFCLNPLLFANCTDAFSKWCKITRGMKRSVQ